MWDPETKEFMDTHGESLERIVKKCVKPQDAYDCFADCCLMKVNDWVKAYDPTIGTLKGYVTMNLKFYIMKWKGKNYKRQTSWPETLDTRVYNDVRLEHYLTAEETKLLELRHIEGYSIDEAASCLGLTRRYAQEVYARAKVRIHEIL